MSGAMVALHGEEATLAGAEAEIKNILTEDATADEAFDQIREQYHNQAHQHHEDRERRGVRIGHVLNQIKDEGLYREAGYRTWGGLREGPGSSPSAIAVCGS